jgi:hypothetical protein
MELISTATPKDPVFVSTDRGGADGKIQVENSSNSRIPSKEISCKVITPDSLTVELGNAISTDKTTWRPVRDLNPMKRISMPIFIKNTSNDNVSESYINITIEIRGQVQNQSSVEIWI